MSYNDTFWEELEKKQKKKKDKSSNEIEIKTSNSNPDKTSTSDSAVKSKHEDYTDNFWAEYNKSQKGKKEDDEDDIAPIDIAPLFKDPKYKEYREAKANVEPEKERTWLQPGLYRDGYRFGDLALSILGTVGDVGVGVAQGFAQTAEGLADLAAYGIAGVGDVFGADDFAYFVREEARENYVGNLADKVRKVTNIDDASFLGDKSRGVPNGLGQVAAVIATGGAGAAGGLGKVGTTLLTAGLLGGSSAGSGMGEAYAGGANDAEAAIYGFTQGTIDAVSELFFGGLGKGFKALGISKGLTSIDDVLAKKLSNAAAKYITSEAGQKVVGNALEYAVKSSAEGLEEVIAGFGSAMAKDIIYMNGENEEDFNKILEDENLLEQFVASSISSGFAQGGSFVESTKSGRDFVTGLSKNEQAVADKVYENAVAERESDGKKLTTKEKNKLYDEVVREMERGYISTDTIESVLGGKSYENYKNLTEQENTLKSKKTELENEIKELVKTPEQQFTIEQRERLDSLREEAKGIKEQIKGLDTKTAKTNLFNEVDKLTSKDTLLRESYNEIIRKTQDIDIDENQYNGTKFADAAKKTIENARKANANNSNRVRDFVEFSAKYSSQSGVVVDFRNENQIKQILENQLKSDIAKETDEAKLAELQDTLKQVQEGKIKVNGVKTKNGVAINLESPNYLNAVLGHEVTHFLENTDAYKALQNAVFKYAQTKKDYDGRRKILEILYKNVDGTTVDQELTADLIGDYLFTEYDFIKSLSTENRNVFQKVYDKIKHMFKLATAGSKEARELEKLMHQFEKALRESVEVSQSVEQNEVATQFSLSDDLASLNHGASLADIDNDGNIGYNGNDLYTTTENFNINVDWNDKNTFSRSLANKTVGIERGEVRTVEIYGADKVYFFEATGYMQGHMLSSVSADDYDGFIKARKEYINGINRNSETFDSWTNVLSSYRAGAGSDISDIGIGQRENDADGIYGESRTRNSSGTQERSGQNFKDDPEEVNNILNKLREEYGITETSSTSDVFFDGENTDVRFSLSKAVEGTKDLVAIHNLQSSELFKTLELGGLPMPSIAVIKAQQGHEQYGDVSLIFSKDTIDPEKNSDNKVYGGDAWTPTYPRIEYKPNDKVARKISDKYYELAKNIGYDEVRPMYRYANELEDALNRDGGEAAMLEKLYDDTGMMNVYLQDSGKGKIEPIVKESVTKISDAQAETNQFIIDTLGEDFVTSLKAPDGVNGMKYRAEFMEQHEEKIRDAYKRYFAEVHGFTAEEIDSVFENITKRDLMKIMRDAYMYTQNSGVTARTETDTAATDEAIRAAAADGYKEWVDGLFKGIEEKSGIRNNQDYYTRSGNPRSWDALHWENTLENVVKVMKGQEATGVGSFSPFNALFGLSHKRYDSIQGIKADSNRLGKIDQDEYEATKDSFSERFAAIAESIKDPDERNPFIAMDTAAEQIIEAVRTKKTKAGILNYLKEMNSGATMQTVEEVISLVSDIANMPTGYFEAKPQRAVGLDEVGVFVIPRNADVKLKQELLNRGYAIAEYDPDIEGDRQKVVNSFEEYKFSLSDAGENRKLGGSYRFDGKDFTVKSDIAPVREDIAPDTPTAENVTAEEIPMPTDADAPPIPDEILPMTEEEANAIQDEKVNAHSATSLEAIQTELANVKDLRSESYASFEQKIANKQAEYNAKKNKDTKVANNLRMQIERLKRLRDSTDSDYAKRISTLETREKLVQEGKPTTRQEHYNNIMNDVKATFSSVGFDFDDVLEKAKNLSTFSTVDNTPQRVMEKALGYKEGQVLSDLTVNKVAQNETEGIKWLNSFTDRKNGLLAQISKQYNIKPGSKESAAAQMYAEGFYVTENDDIVAYGDAELAQDFPDATVRNNIKGLAQDQRIRQIYDETLEAINESRTRNAYPEIQKLDNYFLHFRAMEDTFSKLGLPFNPNDIRAKDLPTDLNGVTADLKPGQPYFASSMHRKGKRTSFDLLGGLERYLTSAKNQIYHIDDIQTLRALRNYIADTYGQAKGLEGIDALTEEEAQERVEQVYGSHLSTFAKFLNEEANVLAGKTALIDRGLEGIIGRRGMTFLDTVNKQTGSNLVGFSISSPLTNFLSAAQAFAKTSKFDFLKAFTQTVSNKLGSITGKNDNFAENSPVIIRRKGAERFYRTPYQKAGDWGYVLMGAVDDISTELIARTKYNELTRKGMDEQTAHFETDKWVSRLMGDRSLGQQPQLFNSKTLGVLTKFQLEVRNQLDSQFYDTIQEAKVSNEDIENGLARNAKIAAKVTSTFVQLAVAQHLFGKAFESVAGYNPAFDIISTLATMFGADDDEESEDTVLDNIEQGFLELLEDLPYTSVFTGGRIPISNALPIAEVIQGKDSYGNEKPRLETIGEALPYYVLPGGYGQIKKTMQGLGMFSDDHPVAGSYTDSGNLRFPVEDTPLNRLQAGLFGQYASKNAREYFDNDYAPLKEKQIQEYIDVDIPIKDYWEYRKGLSDLAPLPGNESVTLNQKGDYIGGLDLPVSKKNILINNIADRSKPIDFTGYENYSDFEEFDFATRFPEKYAVLKEQGISVADYKANYEETAFLYTDDFSWAANNPEKYTLSKAVTNDVEEYKRYTTELYNIKADKDSNGKSISGSRKEKVLDYINNLDLDYGAKIILFKSEYPSDNTYNYDIIDYLNNHSDLTYEDRVTIYRELGFRVTSDGRIYAE